MRAPTQASAPESPIGATGDDHSFTLLEILVVMAIIGIVLSLVVPALAPATARALDGGARQFMSELQSARMTAIAERTHVRVLIPNAINGAIREDLVLRSYTTAVLDRTTGTWRQRSKWARLPDGIAIDPTVGVVRPSASPMPGETQMVGWPTAYSGPYLEFLANGSASLDPTAPPAAVKLADGFVQSGGAFVAKNRTLFREVTIDPLSGAVTAR